LLAALSLVRTDVPDARLVIVGDGALRPSLEARVATSGLGDSVEFLGFVPEIWPYLAEADLFVTASVSEGFGIAIAEAMAAGLPVVGPEVGAIPELVRPGVTGQLFPAGDHVALAARVVDLLRSPEVRSQMSAAARESADVLRMENVVERYFRLFDDVHSLGKRGRTADDGLGVHLRRGSTSSG
jgi:glycosyltransferase involved in cell wall biosynthesis